MAKVVASLVAIMGLSGLAACAPVDATWSSLRMPAVLAGAGAQNTSAGYGEMAPHAGGLGAGTGVQAAIAWS